MKYKILPLPILLSGMLALLSPGCQSPPVYSDHPGFAAPNASMVDVGMTETEVRAALGRPSSVLSSTGGMPKLVGTRLVYPEPKKALIYTNLRGSGPGAYFYVIFQNGKVVEYLNSGVLASFVIPN